jgi:mannosyltransferase OCH1-like enzyme
MNRRGVLGGAAVLLGGWQLLWTLQSSLTWILPPTDMLPLSSSPPLPTEWNTTMSPVRKDDTASALPLALVRNESTASPPLSMAKPSRSVSRHNISWISNARRKETPSSETVCAPPLLAFHDTIVEGHEEDDAPPDAAIPRVVHVASISRCMTPPYAANLQRWRFANHSLRVHDDAAVNELLSGSRGSSSSSNTTQFARYFPRLDQALHCLPRNGASSPSKADLWRYLQLWHTGGIYTDIDNAPGAMFGQGLDAPLAALTTSASTKVDALIALNRHGKLGQSFLVLTPRHPLMRLCALIAIDRLLAVTKLSTQITWKVTGPDVLDAAFTEFAGQALTRTAAGGIVNGTYPLQSSLAASWRRAFPGEAWIHTNRSLTVVGNPQEPDDYVETSVIRGAEKMLFYKLTGMSHWKGLQGQHESDLSCVAWLAQRDVTATSRQ